MFTLNFKVNFLGFGVIFGFLMFNVFDEIFSFVLLLVTVCLYF